VTGLIRSLTASWTLACPITVLPISVPDRKLTFDVQRRNAVPMLAELVDHVIGVDMHKHTNTAAIVSAATAAVIETTAAGTDPDGYQHLLSLAERSGGLQA
jgi:hypothetical protein